jgi:hypothetical protein
LETNFIWVVGALLRQGLDDDQHKRKSASKLAFLALLHLYSLLISSMYCSVVTSLLLAKVKLPNPEDLYDLAYTFPDMKIYVQTGSNARATILNSEYYDLLRPRLIEYNPRDIPDFYSYMIKQYENIANGTHVMVQV